MHMIVEPHKRKYALAKKKQLNNIPPLMFLDQDVKYISP